MPPEKPDPNTTRISYLLARCARIEVTEHSVGCFRNQTVYSEVRRSDGAYIFLEHETTWDTDRPSKIVEKKTIGEITLTENDVRGLDGLLKFYRGPKEASSTTRVSLLVEYFEPAGRVKAERLQDNSGGYGLGYREDVLTFWALSKRFRGADIESTAPVKAEPSVPSPAR